MSTSWSVVGRKEKRGGEGRHIGTFILQITANESHDPPHPPTTRLPPQSPSHPLNISSKPGSVFFPSEVGTTLPAFAISLIT